MLVFPLRIELCTHYRSLRVPYQEPKPRSRQLLLIFQNRQWRFFSHTLHLFLCLSTDGAARIYLIYLFENARTPFLCV